MTIKYITGYAGTGKSYELLQLLKTLPPKETMVLAPTHKALQRLGITSHAIATIHSFLGWIPQINEEAKRVEHIDVTMKRDRVHTDIKYLVIDEAGMMSEDMLYSITDTYSFKYIYCFLDPYQLLSLKKIS